MRADTQTISIDTAPDQVQRYLGGGQNLPRWAVGFAKAVRPATDGGWVVETGAGEMGLRIDVDARAGTIDFWMTPAPGVLVLAASRVIPRGNGSDTSSPSSRAPACPMTSSPGVCRRCGTSSRC